MTGNHPIAVRGIDHVVIRANDVQRMLAFYAEVLNCRLEREVAELGLFQLRAGSALIDIVDAAGELGRQSGNPPDPKARNMDHLCLLIEPWHEATIISHLAEHGVTGGDVVTRYGAVGNGPSIYIADPEGNAIELKGAPSAG